jgi:hypothetical protein
MTTGILTVLAHRLASALLTSRPSGATVAFVPRDIVPVACDDTLVEAAGKEESGSEARSSLLPTSRRERFGLARARASLRKGWMPRKVEWDVRS